MCNSSNALESTTHLCFLYKNKWLYVGSYNKVWICFARVGYSFKMDFQWYEFKKVRMFLWVMQLDASSSLSRAVRNAQIKYIFVRW